LKLGRGSLSDVEWTLQILQLQFGNEFPELRTPSTLAGLQAAVTRGLLTAEVELKLRVAWLLSSRIRSAMTLWAQRSSDVLPRDVAELEGVARLLDYPRGSATRLEEDYLSVTRRCRAVVERVFYQAAK
jgi:glutamate-ammonia-ligase adenylyltransferase